MQYMCLIRIVFYSYHYWHYWTAICSFFLFFLACFVYYVHSVDFFPARRYASAGTSYGPAPVCVTSQCSIERDERIDLLFVMKASFDQSHTVL